MKILTEVILETLKTYQRANLSDENTRKAIAETITGVYMASIPEKKNLCELIREKKVQPKAFPPGA